MKMRSAAKTAGTPRKRARFFLDAPHAREVSVAGTFNGWDPARDFLKRKGEGNWVLVRYLSPGAHEYRFVVDGIWTTDPLCATRCRNIYGGENSVIQI